MLCLVYALLGDQHRVCRVSGGTCVSVSSTGVLGHVHVWPGRCGLCSVPAEAVRPGAEGESHECTDSFQWCATIVCRKWRSLVLPHGLAWETALLCVPPPPPQQVRVTVRVGVTELVEPVLVL